MAKNSKKSIEERRKHILYYLSSHSNVSVEELSDQLDASAITIRRDLNQLISDKMVARGSAGRFSLLQDPAFDDQYFRRYSLHHKEKVIIANGAIQLIPNNCMIGIDSSTTCLELSKLLLAREKITVVTNNLFIPQYLSQHTSLDLFCIGGHVHLHNNSTEGSGACDEIYKYNYDFVFFSASALDFEGGLSNSDFNEIDTKMAFLSRAAKKILLLDSAKIGLRASRNFLSLDEVDLIVTDSGVSEDQLAKFEQLGIRCLVAHP